MMSFHGMSLLCQCFITDKDKPVTSTEVNRNRKHLITEEFNVSWPSRARKVRLKGDIQCSWKEVPSVSAL